MRRRVPLLRDLLLALRWPSGHASSSTLRDVSSSTLRDASSSTLRGCSLASSHVCNRCWQSSLYHRDSKRPRHLSAVDGNSLACPTREPTTEQYFKDMETSICTMQTEEEASGIDCPQYDFKDMMESLCSIKKEEDLCSIKKEEEEDLCSIKKEEEEDLCSIKKEEEEDLCSIKKEEEDLCSIKKEEEEDLCSIKKEEEEDLCSIKKEEEEDLCSIKKEEEEDLCSIKKEEEEDLCSIKKEEEEDLCSIKKEEEDLCSIKKEEEEDLCSIKKEEEEDLCSIKKEEEEDLCSIKKEEEEDLCSIKKEEEEDLCSIKKEEEEDLCSIKKEEEEDRCSIKKEEEEDTSEIDETMKLWESEQVRLKKLCCLEDTEPWQIGRLALGITSSEEEEEESTDQVTPLMYIAGTDISFVKNNETNACAAIVVVKLPSFEVVYEDISMVELTAPYIPGFLAFREADFLIKKLELLRESRPDIIPQAIIVDGNGIFHPREFGLACHIGVHLGIPTVGAAKTLYHVDGIEKNEDHQNKIKTLLKRGGDQFPLVGQSGKTLGVALRSCHKSTNPIYISPGHNISMETAVWLVQLCCKFRVPEPVRQADIKSREYIRENWKPDAAA